MRPLIKPALRRIWRGTNTVQFGTDPDRAVLISNLDPEIAPIIGELNGKRTMAGVITYALANGICRSTVLRLLELLTGAGILDDGKPRGMRLSGLSATERARLLPDLRSMSLLGGSGNDGVDGLVRRRKSTVAIYGAGRVGSQLATVLAAGGMGGLLVVDGTPARPADLAPGGLSDLDLDGSRADGTRRAVAATSRSTRAPKPSTASRRPHLAIVAPDEKPDRRLLSGLMRGGIPHLVVRVVEARGIIGPFVIPGKTSCVRCADLYRADRDPAYPQVLAQILTEPATMRACDVALAKTTAGLAAMHVQQFIGGDHPDSFGATVELIGPSGRWRRRTWKPHPECGCHWDHLTSTANPEVAATC